MRRIVQFSDPHLVGVGETLKDVDTFARFQRCVETALRMPQTSDASSYIISGDIAHDESRETYERLNVYLNEVGGEWFCIPGNHDDPSLLYEVMPQRCIEPVVGWRSTQLNASLNVHLLSSHVPGEVGGALNEASLVSLAKASSQAQLVVLHHPPLSLNDPLFDAMALSNQAGFWAQIEKNDSIVGVLFGHAHRAYEEIRETGGQRVSVLGCPSTAFQYGMDNDHPFGFDPSRFGFRALNYDDTRGLETEVVWLDA